MKKALIAALLFGSLFATTLPAEEGKIAGRKENQQDRIANGVKSGKLTAGETARLENKETKLNKEIRSDRSVNGGKLTAADKKQVNRQQNNVSRRIYKDKLNAAVQ
jgi:hypothetical protein